MHTIIEITDSSIDGASVAAFNTTGNDINNSANNKSEHVLYSRGHLLDGVDYFLSLQKIAEFTRRDSQKVEERILNGKRKKMKSHHSLEKLILLEAKFRQIGLDVYIESESI